MGRPWQAERGHIRLAALVVVALSAVLVLAVRAWTNGHDAGEVGVELPVVQGPLPESIRIDESYPPLREGFVERVLMAMGVVDDTATLERFLVLDESWQVFEIDVTLPRERRGPTMSEGALSPDGTRVVLGLAGGYVVLDLRDLSRRVVPVAGSTLDLSWSGGRVVVGSSDEGTARSRRIGVLPDGHVLSESRTGSQLRVLDRDVATGRVGLVSTIEPALASEWYLLTSYADLADR